MEGKEKNKDGDNINTKPGKFLFLSDVDEARDKDIRKIYLTYLEKFEKLTDEERTAYTYFMLMTSMTDITIHEDGNGFYSEPLGEPDKPKTDPMNEGMSKGLFHESQHSTFLDIKWIKPLGMIERIVCVCIAKNLDLYKDGEFAYVYRNWYQLHKETGVVGFPEPEKVTELARGYGIEGKYSIIVIYEPLKDLKYQTGEDGE